MPKRTKGFREQLLKDLIDQSEAAEYVNAASEDSEEMFLIALRDVAEARQMARVANEAGVAREALYRMLSEEGNPRLNTLWAILNAVGLHIQVEPIAPYGSTLKNTNKPTAKNTRVRLRHH
jgi:probable addiction module antidote protein